MTMLANILRHQTHYRARAALRSMSTQRLTDYKQAFDLYKPGQAIHGYQVLAVHNVPEYNMAAIVVEHDKTKAQHLHIARADENNSFAVGFRTTPMNSTGVPHILEHTVLCGSERYPCRDPFFKMLSRSLSNFMNAFTASDYTMYPFATTNQADFRNLLGVYTDAVFFPLLSANDFAQEGWRLEHQDPTDKSSPLEFKGVVFNEMKGAFSPVDMLYWTRSQQLMHPNTTYAHVSGGEPLAILDLTHEDLVEFHKKHYHPSNSKFFTYGDMPLEDHLAFIDEHVLRKFGPMTPPSSPTRTERWSEPQEHRLHCAIDPTSPADEQVRASMSFLLTDDSDVYQATCLRILCNLLTDGTHSPFYQALLDKGIGKDFTANTGYDGSTEVATFGIGVQGMKEDQVADMKTAIRQALEHVAQNGFETEVVEAFLHQMKLSLRDEKDKFGLNLSSSLIGPWLRGAPLPDLLAVNKLLTRFELAWRSNPTLFQDLVKEHFLNNQHVMTLIMTPDEDYNKKLDEQEQAKLERVVGGLIPEDKEFIYQRGLELLDKQSQVEDVSVLPTLHVRDIPRQGTYTTPDLSSLSGTNVMTFNQPTNGLIYYRSKLAIDQVKPEDIMYLPVFAHMLTKCGAGDVPYSEWGKRVRMVTGGMGASATQVVHHSDPAQFSPFLMLSSSALHENVDAMFGLWNDVINHARVHDTHFLGNTLRMAASEALDGIAWSGHSMACTLAASTLTPSRAYAELSGGLSHVQHLQSMVAEDANLDNIAQHLSNLKDTLMFKDTMQTALHLDPANVDSVHASLDALLDNVATGAELGQSFSPEASPLTKALQNSPHQRLAIATPFMVNFSSKAIPGVAYTHPDHAPLSLALSMMSLKFLHREIREKGGAYGGGVKQAAGVITFYSYREPDAKRSLQAYNESCDWIQNSAFTDDDLEEAKLMAFQGVDAPVPASRKGLGLFTQGLTPELLQQRRERLLDVTREDVARVARTYLNAETVENASSVVIATEQQAQELQKELGYDIESL
eukprot:TRINITY_DN12009_c0_g1_i1.p1 TRINITY_DN12009_c0_g1~~TRINITY_DN12009_c0_g1_i1.p1  ORF type:complete len:1016 (+),score=241.10 TRINITY_DN12009_c0_g1_i1:830-3877(+)